MASDQLNYSYERASRTPVKDSDRMHWQRELELFQYRAPNPNAPVDTKEGRGWGFPTNMKPPADCYEIALANLKKQFDMRLDEPIRPEYKYSLVTTLSAYFSWLRTVPGTMWLLHLYGIRLLKNHPGFVYFYQGEALTPPRFSVRIYQINRSERTLKDPIEYYGLELTDKLNDILENRRGPSPSPIPKASEGMWRWTGAQLRNWLSETKADTSWPTTKPDRIAGYVWAKGLLESGTPNQFKWSVIGQAEAISHSESRLYRIQSPAYEEQMVNGIVRQVPPANPGVLWVTRADMRMVPLDKLDAHAGVQPAHIDRKYKCSSCQRVLCCTTTSGNLREQLCMNCRGVQIESGERPSLTWCTYRECRNCPSHIRNTEDKINMISRLNTTHSVPR